MALHIRNSTPPLKNKQHELNFSIAKEIQFEGKSKLLLERHFSEIITCNIMKHIIQCILFGDKLKQNNSQAIILKRTALRMIN